MIFIVNLSLTSIPNPNQRSMGSKSFIRCQLIPHPPAACTYKTPGLLYLTLHYKEFRFIPFSCQKYSCLSLCGTILGANRMTDHLHLRQKHKNCQCNSKRACEEPPAPARNPFFIHVPPTAACANQQPT